MSNYLTLDQKQEFLDVATVNGRFVLASGIEADTKFDFDRVATDSKLFGVAVDAMTLLIQDTIDFDEYDSLAVVTVATGANRLGDQLADNLMMYHVPSHKDLDGNFYIPERTERTVGILVDDVYTTGSSFEKVKSQFRGKIIGVYALLDRSGRFNSEISGGIKVYSVFQHEF